MHEANRNRNSKIPCFPLLPSRRWIVPASNIGALAGECAAKDCAEVVDHFVFLWKPGQNPADTSPRVADRVGF